MLNAATFMKELLSLNSSSDTADSGTDFLVNSNIADDISSTNFHRQLEDVSTDTEDVYEEKQFDPVVFWCVNAIWITVLVSVIIWIWKFDGAARITAWTHAMVSHDSDIAYRRRLASRQRALEEAKRITPEERRKILEEYYRTNKVQMVSSCFAKRPSFPYSFDCSFCINLDSMHSLIIHSLLLHSDCY
jgi:hypothetical protein